MTGRAESAEPSPAHAGGAGSERRVSWDSLRIGFVLLVVVYHSTFIGPIVYRDILPKNVVFAHQVGASLLLVLSAYFVAATVRRGGARPGASARWWWGRVARLMPAFVVATINAWLFLRYLAPEGWYLPTTRDLVANLMMLWHWDARRWGYVDGSYWTIPLQLLAFSVAAVMWRTRLGRGRALRVVMWLALIVPALQWHHHATLPFDDPYVLAINGLGLHRWHLFVAGVAVWMYATGRLRRWHFAALVVGSVAAHALHAGALSPDGYWGTDVAAVVMIAGGIALMTAAAVGPDWTWIRGRGRRLVSWLAGISYGIFLVHQTVGYVVMKRLQDVGVGPTLQTAAMVLTGVVGGWLMTRAVERPAHRALMWWWDRGPARYGRAVPSRPVPAEVPGPSSTTRS